MIIEALTFIAANKAIITGAAITIGELCIIVHNYRRKIKAEEVAVTKSTCSDEFVSLAMTFWEKIWWSANPINVFRKP
jgi:hypothetical protein